MTFLPIVERELRTAARLPATYRNRAIAAGLVMLAALVMVLLGIFARSASQAGANMFHTLSFIAMLFCAAEGARKTADCLSEEKREGTLGLLFLTDLKGYDVVLGKLAATSLNSMYGLFAILPVLALPLLVGGVTQAEYWRMVLALANLLFFSLCAGMVVSAGCRQENRAMSATFFLVLAFMLLPEFSGIPTLAPVSPAHAYFSSFASAYFRDARGYWQSLGIAQALSWLMLVCASVMLPRLWQETRVEAASFSGPFRSGNARRTELRRQMLTTNPALWLAARNSDRPVFLWALVVVAGLSAVFCLSSYRPFSLLVYLCIAWVINFALKMRVAAQACHCLAEARRNNSLEMLLVTPLTVKEIIDGQLLALRRIFLGPIVAIALIEFGALLASIALEDDRNGPAKGAFTVILGTIYFGLSLLDLAAVVWAGMWFGLTAKKETQAVSKTILLVLILPCACLLFYCFGLPFFIGIPIFWIAWCSSKLKYEFRALAGQRYAPPPSSSAWLTGAESPRVPPIIVR